MKNSAVPATNPKAVKGRCAARCPARLAATRTNDIALRRTSVNMGNMAVDLMSGEA